MNYPEFETAFEAQFQKHTNAYPHAVEYHRVRFNQTIQYLLSSILEQTDSLVQQPETNWTHNDLEVEAESLEPLRFLIGGTVSSVERWGV